jgi:DNA ligase-1
MTSTLWDSTKMQPNGWWMTEKYDGVRLYWNGKQFFSRQGRKVTVPDFISKQLPPTSLDGELW